MRDEAQRRIGHLYPQIAITLEMARQRPDLQRYLGRKLTVIAWLWARTVKSPHPQYAHVDVPLVSTFVLAKKKDHEAYVEPMVDGDSYRFEVKIGKPPKSAEPGTKAGGKSSNFTCILSQTTITGKYIKSESMAGRMSSRLLAIVCEGERGRVYLSPDAYQEEIARQAQPAWKPDFEMNRKSTDLVSGRGYGFFMWSDLFTPRQLVALDTFSTLIQEAREKVRQDARRAGIPDDGCPLAQGGSQATAYADAIAVYLAFAVDKLANYCSTLNTYANSGGFIVQVFGRQCIPMKWDYAEAHPLGDATGCFISMIDWVVKSLIIMPAYGLGYAKQFDAQTQMVSNGKVISTDPPYYDNICYADLSDYFYVWLRRNLRPVFPELFRTLAVPKTEELVASAYRHGSKEAAESFFMDGMTATMHNLAEQAHSAFPVTIYYAFKSSDTDTQGTSNTGWETFLAAVLKSGFMITGTWPIHTERENGLKTGDNVLSSCIVLVCRRRAADAAEVSRREFMSELRRVMPEALRAMMGQDGASSTPIAPVDLAQAAIGPGMEIFSKYRAVLKADGTPMTVHEALLEINREISDTLNPDSQSFDAATLFCYDWYRQYGWEAGAYGVADTLARAKTVSVESLRHAGVVTAERGEVALVRWQDYPEEPVVTHNAWQNCHQLVRSLDAHGEEATGKLLAKMRSDKDTIRQLAYALYTDCERRGLAEDARYYNDLMTSWQGIMRASSEHTPEQGELGL